MNTMNHLTAIFTSLALALVLGACGTKDKNNSRNGGHSADGQGDTPRDRRQTGGETPTPGNDEGTAIVEEEEETTTEETPTTKEETAQEEVPLFDVETAVGVRNYDQINYSLSSLTGVPTTNPRVAAEFLDLKAQLPDDNSIKAVTPAKVSGLTKLAAQYCNEATLDATLRAQVLPGFDFAAAPAQAFADPAMVAKTLLDTLWGTGMDGLADQQGDIDIIVQLIEDTRSGNAGATTQFIAMSACTAVLSAAPVFLL